jgi:hypothetical protein
VASEEATIHVAIDGEEYGSGNPINVMSGTSIEVDFFFEDMPGMQKQWPIIGRFQEDEPHTAVGMEIIVEPDWRVLLGTAAAPEGWSSWWQRGASGKGELKMTSWEPTEDKAGAYYLDFGASPWRAYGNLPGLALDGGNETKGDLDGIGGRMGADATIWVSSDTPAGHYEITIAGVGHDSKGRRAHVAHVIPVDISASGFTGTGPGSPEGAWVYENVCLSCHEDTPEEKRRLFVGGAQGIESVLEWGKRSMEPIRGLSEKEINALVEYIEAGAMEGPGKNPPPMAHAPIGWAICKDCHGEAAGGRPGPGTGKHTDYPNGQCLVCHPRGVGLAGVIPEILHPTENMRCDSCHGPTGARPAPGGHEGLKQDMCLGCHEVSPAMVGVEMTQVPHPGEGWACLKCHAPTGLVPVPGTHEGRGENSCMICHEVAKEMVGVEMTAVPHPLRSGGGCGSCHGSTGFKPMPQDHLGRAESLCVACHEADQEAIAAIPPIAHSPEGREACVACHSPAGWVPSPESHWGRTQETCLVCH